MWLSNRYFLVIALGLALFLTDFITKQYVFNHIPLGYSSYSYPFGGIPVFHNFLGIDFSLNHAANKGAAWGAFADFQLYLLALRIILIISMIIYVAFFNKRSAWQIPLVLIIAGALGNVVDYFIYGHVIDMFHFILWGYDYPVFNIADATIFIGISWLLIGSWGNKAAYEKSK